MAETTEVGKLRREWLEAVRQAHGLLRGFAVSAEVLSFDSTTDRTAGPLAEIRFAQEKADVIRVAYEDALANHRGQQDDLRAAQADELARTNTKLARVQAWLAGAITFATVVQLIIAGLALWRTW